MEATIILGDDTDFLDVEELLRTPLEEDDLETEAFFAEEHTFITVLLR